MLLPSAHPQPPIDPKRGEVWRVSLDPVQGSELAKTRPAVVVSLDSIGREGVRVIVPLTAWQPEYQPLFFLPSIAPAPSNGLTKDSAADTSQVRAAALARFAARLGSLTADETDTIAAALCFLAGHKQAYHGRRLKDVAAAETSLPEAELERLLDARAMTEGGIKGGGGG